MDDKLLVKSMLFKAKLADLGVVQIIPKHQSFRINRLKVSDDSKIIQELTTLGFTLNKISFPDAYEVISSTIPLSSTQFFKEGYIYIQNLSSMLPVNYLNLQPGDVVLDMCAAPGSKTSQIAESLNGVGSIVACENNVGRMHALRKNLQTLLGDYVNMCEFLRINSAILSKAFPHYIEKFDKVLLDAPCSNEGLIDPDDPSSISKWNPKASKSLSLLQKKLLCEGLRLLKPGGTLVYSTCTFSKSENEDVVNFGIKKTVSVEVFDVKRIIPDGKFCGFFVSKLVKKN